ncbi:hypothetical protein FQP90_08920 [Paenarthrobacter nitroguajacolicus]|uniref:Uncharacterized protein n=1 Tax=Paenarthrobacter nitroguajacolicus TaxID=211146 RepID=A0A558H4P9_PAENT|nr:hypothetical protein [Paenarthrobacter nitroguajacolicus]TVU64099.1 hypothetical protein FQP90_08920 [Paenarthrobacter nitroguajacolicus]
MTAHIVGHAPVPTSDPKPSAGRPGVTALGVLKERVYTAQTVNDYYGIIEQLTKNTAKFSVHGSVHNSRHPVRARTCEGMQAAKAQGRLSRKQLVLRMMDRHRDDQTLEGCHNDIDGATA